MYDIAIIGGGIVGLATGLALRERHPRARLLLVEKEPGWAAHQSGRNSGVIHSGIYYRPGSLKARLSRSGNRSLVAFCREHELPHEICGKVIVAAEQNELGRLDEFYRRGLANGLQIEKIGPERLRDMEPHAEGLAAIRVPDTGIADYRRVSETMARLLKERGCDLRLNTRINRLLADRSPMVLESDQDAFEARLLINCAGLYSDRVARLGGVEARMKIIPFRGEYYRLKPEKRHLVKNLVYPVPDPEFPFLGVHFTRMIDGEVHAGPNAMLAFKREGYAKGDFDPRDLGEVLTYPAFWKLAARHWREGAREMIRSFSKAAFVRGLQRLVPEITTDDIVPSTAGIRAQALMDDGQLSDDFVIVPGPGSLHVCNAPSPAATASLEIGRAVAERADL
jgi:L-2-hydroxyglutarate oxidase